MVAVLIYLIIPLAGVIVFLRILKKIKAENISDPPKIGLFPIFATYGGLLILVLTSLFWEWSGMASLGVFYLILIAPFIMAGIALNNYNKREESPYHQWAFRAGAMYFGIAPLVFILLLLFSKN